MNNNKRGGNIIVAVKGFILHQGKTLLVQRTVSDTIGGGTWECAGGKIEFGETLEMALIREIQEETGLEVTVQHLLYATSFLTDPSRQLVLLTYLCGAQQNEIRLSSEHTDYRWCTKDELLTLLPSHIIDDLEQNGVFTLKVLQ